MCSSRIAALFSLAGPRGALVTRDWPHTLRDVLRPAARPKHHCVGTARVSPYANGSVDRGDFSLPHLDLRRAMGGCLKGRPPAF
jgi:hypothetical protein